MKNFTLKNSSEIAEMNFFSDSFVSRQAKRFGFSFNASMKLMFLLLSIFSFEVNTYSQTTYDWLNTAPDGNFRQGAFGARWNPGGLFDEPPYGIVQFNNNNQTTMTNNVAGTWSQFKFNFGSSATTARTIGGNTVQFFDFSGTWPFVQNQSTATHTVNFPILVGTSGTFNLELIANAGNLVFGGTLGNQGKNVLVYGNNSSIDASNRSVTLGGVTSGSGKLIVSQFGVAKLNATHTYTGNTEIDNGELWNMTTGDAIASGSAIFIGNGGQLTNVCKFWLTNASGTTFSRNITINNGNSNTRFLGGFTTNVSHTFSGSITNNSTTGGLNLSALSSGGTVTFSGAISGSSAVFTDSSMAGTIVLSNTGSSYSGITQANAGFLRAGGSASVVGTSNGAFGSSATLNLNGGTIQNGTSGTFSRNMSVTATNSGLDAFGAARTISSAITMASGTMNLNVGGTTVPSATGQDLTLSGVIANTSGTLSLTKIGTSSVFLTGTNTYVGTTTVNAGTLYVNGSTSTSSAVTVASGARLGGNGTVNGTVSLSSGASIVSPGSAASTVGTLTTGAFTFNNNNEYEFNITNVAGAAGTNWDLLTSSGAITVSATSGAPVVIRLSGNPTGFASCTSYTWRIASGTSIGSFAANKFSINATSFTPSFTGTFSVTNSGNDINLVYTPPSTVTINAFSPTTSTRCQGAGTVTTTTTASNSTGITYSLDATTAAFSGNSIVSGTGAVTYAAGWSGTTTITASAAGCNGPATTIHVVTTTTTSTTIAPSTTQNIPVSTNGTILTVTEGTNTVTSRVWKYGTVSGTWGTNTGITTTTYTPNFGSIGNYFVVCETTYASPCSTVVSSNEVQINVTANSITTGTVSGSPFCAGATGVSVPFTYSAPASFPSGGSCTFKAQLSDASGFFTSPTDLQTVVSDASGSQSISVTIPSGTSTGSGYRIRVVSDAPAVDGLDNGTNLIINVTASIASVTGTTPLCIAGTATYTANTVILSGGTGAWSSSNTGIATVNATTGLVTGVAAGTCNIIYTITGGCGGTVSAQQLVTISPNASVASVTGTTPLCIAGTATYTANTVVLGGGTGVWSSSNIGIATVNATTGLVTGVAAGTCNIIYTITGGCGGTVSAQQSVTISPNASVVSVTGTTPLCIAGTATYTANTVVLGGGTGVWSSSNIGIATVNATTGLVTGVAAGTCNIIYTITGGCGGTVSAQQSVTISPNASVVSVTGTTPLCIAGTATYTANTVVLSGGTGAWSSSNTGIATVNATTGLVTGVAAGTCNIIYTITGGCGGTVSVQQSVTINAAPSISVQPSATAVCSGSTANFSVTASGSPTYAWRKRGSGWGTSGTWTSFVGSGQAIASSSGNNNGDTGSAIDVSGNAWRLPINNEAVRSLGGQTLAVGQVINLDFDNGNVATGVSVGFSIRNASDQNLFEFYFTGGGSNYVIGAGSQSGTLPTFTRLGLNIKFTLTSSSTYSVFITRYSDSSTYTITGNLSSPGGGQAITKVRLWNYAGSPGGNADAYYNNLSFGPSGTTSLYDDNAGNYTTWVTTDNRGQGPLANGATGTGSTVSNATTASLSIATVGASDVASYDVVVYNSCGGATSSAAALTLNTPTSISVSSADQSVCSGANATYSVTATGTALIYKWRKNGVDINDGATGNGSTYAGTATATLTINGAVLGDAVASGVGFDCVVSGTCTPTATSTRRALTINATASVASVTGTTPLCISGTATYTANTVVLGGGTGAWSSSNTGVATVNSTTGLVTGVAAGTSNITYTITGGCGGTVSELQSVTISPNASISSVSGTTPLCTSSTATYTANSVVLSGGTGAWSSSNAGVATVNSTTGLVTGVAAGTSNIIYTITGGCGGTVSSLQSVAISPNASIASVSGSTPLCISGSATYTANTAVLSGGTGAWSSSNTGVATVNSTTGLVTGVAAGTSNITYTITGGCGGTVSALQSVTVSAAPTTATNSSTQTICSTGTSTLSGNTPSVGTGAWSVVSGPSTSLSQFSSLSDPTAVFTPASGAGLYSVRWTISNSPCSASNADAIVTVSATNTWTGTASKDWNVASNWSCNAVPNSSTDAVIVSATNSPEIGFSGTTAANCRNLTITSGTLTMSNTSSLTLASTSTFSNNGSFVSGNGTVNFLGSGTITGTIAFHDVNLSGLVSFSNAVTVNNRLRIATGGAVTNNAPTYGSGSLLQYFIGASYNRSLEWTTATSGAGYPANVQISTNGTNTTLNMLTTVAQCSGTLTIDFGNTLNTTSNILTVIGNVLINGTMGLGGDVKTGGNWTVGVSGTQTNNAKAVFFTAATGDQMVTKTGGGIVFFDYLIIDKATSGNLVIESTTNITLNTATGRVLQLNNVGGLDLNGRSLTLNNSGGAIYVNGSRSIVSTLSSPNGTIEINQYKVIQNNSGTGTLSLGDKVTVNLNTNGNLDFGSNITTVNGILSINSNASCFVNTNPPIYSNTSTLIYNSGGTRNRDIEWSTTSGAGYPNDVIVQNVTILEVANGSDAYRKIAGNLTISGAAATTNAGCTNCSRFRITDLYTASPAIVSGTTGVGVEIGGDIINNGRIELEGNTNARLKCTNFTNGQTPGNAQATTSLSGDLNLTPPFNGNYGGDLEVTADFEDNALFVSRQRAVFFTGSGVQDVRGISSPFNIDYVVVAKSGSTSPVLLNKDLAIEGPSGGSAIIFFAATDIIDLNGFKLTVGKAGVSNTITGLGKFKGDGTANDKTTSDLDILGDGDIGTFYFDQTSTSTKTIRNLTLDRTGTGGGFALGSDVNISNQLTLTNGTINLASANMTLGASAPAISIASPNATKMIIASGTGELRKTFSAAGSFTYPIGDNVDTAEYSPATLTFTGSPSGYAGVRVQDDKHPNINVGITDFISRYWPVTSTIVSPSCTAEFTYLAADENGTVANYFGGRYLNPDWYCLSDVDDTNRIISSAVSTFGDFTVYTPPAMTSALTTSAATICANTSTNLQVAIAGGDAPYTVGPYSVVYNDSVSGVVTVTNYTSGANIPVSPTANTTYTLQSVTSSKACYSSATDTKTVNIGGTSTYASSSWTPSAPTATSTAVIDGGVYNVAANINACSLEVKNNAVVTIPSTYKVTLSGALTVANGSSFTLENDSNLVQTDGTTNPNTGSIQVKRNSSSLYLLDYTLWSSPVENQNLYAFSPRTLGNRFYVYDTPTNQYSPIASSNNFTVGKGYLIRVPKDYSSTTPAIYNGVFTGKPNSGTITFPMSMGGTPTIGYGFNATGNPYPSQINVHNFIDANLSNITGTLYFWRKKNDQTQTSYATLTKLGYVANAAPGGGTTNTFNYFNTTNNAANTWVINVGQGFFVKATNAANLVFTNAMRRGVNNSNQFFRTSNKSNGDASLYKLTVTSNNGFYSQMLVGYSTDYTLGVDPGIDGEPDSINNDYFCSSIGGAPYRIQGRPEFTPTDIVPLQYKIATADEYTITIEQFDGLFGTQDVFIKDKLTNVIHNLKTGPYTFGSESGLFTDRFEVVYENTLSTSDPKFNQNSVLVYKQNQDVVINNGKVKMSNVKIYDIRGRLLVSKNNINATQVKMHAGSTQQVLIVKITSDTNGVVTKKVIN